MTDFQDDLDRVSAAFNRRAWPEALRQALGLLDAVPHNAMLHYICGVASLEQEQVPAALTHLARAAELAPDNAEFGVHHAKALALARRTHDARREAERASRLPCEHAATLDTLGVVFTRIGAHDQAVGVFRRATELAPGLAVYHYNLATALIAAGELTGAAKALEACLARDPRYWRAHLTLAQLARQTPESNHVERLRGLLDGLADGPAETQAQICLNMALAKELEDLGEYPQALIHLTRGKAAAGRGRSYTIADDERLFGALQARFPVGTAPAAGFGSDQAIFVVGMPRTGTTLVERIISSHPRVHSAGELLNFGMAVKYLSGSRSPRLIDVDTIDGTAGIDFGTLGRTYLASARPMSGGAPHFVDKLPHNFLYLGYIAQSLPNAKIVCLRRNPMDTCLSNFRQLFAPQSPYFDYSFELADIGRYYVLFDRLMRHWREVFPGRVLEVPYEALVDDQEGWSRRIVDFCGLTWDPACLGFEANPAPVATASAVQVRAPIYRSALQRWKRYGEGLAPLQRVLEQAGIDIEG